MIFNDLDTQLLEFWTTTEPLLLSIILVFGFCLLYSSITCCFYWIGNWFLKKGWCLRQNDSALIPNQIRFEIRHSFYSVLVFAAYGMLIYYAFQKGLVAFVHKGVWGVLFDLLLLAVWNEIHFYTCHRLMHSKYLIKFHGIHHRSIVVTPFSTYSFHPLESVLNGSVLILFMFMYDISILSFLLFPIYHLFFNTMGHTNLRLKENNGLFRRTFISGHHMLHHKKGKVNYSFVTHILDRMFKSYTN